MTKLQWQRITPLLRNGDPINILVGRDIPFALVIATGVQRWTGVTLIGGEKATGEIFDKHLY